MRNDSASWNVPDLERVVVVSDALTVTQVQPNRQVLISGVNARQSNQLTLVGWPGDVSTDGYALVLRRDRVLEVDGEPREDGWDEKNQYAVSDVTDGFAVFEISGDGAVDLLKQGGFVNPNEASASVARRMFGLSVLLYRTATLTYRLHINSMLAQALREQIKSRTANRNAQPNDVTPGRPK